MVWSAVPLLWSATLAWSSVACASSATRCLIFSLVCSPFCPLAAIVEKKRPLAAREVGAEAGAGAVDAGGVPLADFQSLSVYYGLTSFFLDRQSRSLVVVPGIGARRVWRVRSYYTHFYKVDG